MSTSSLIASVTDRFPDAVSSSHTYRGDATVVLRPESLLEVARFLKDDPALKMNYLMDVTAVDYSAFGKAPAPAFFASSGVAVSPSPEIPDEDPWPGPPDSSRFTVVSCTTSSRRPTSIDCGWWFQSKRVSPRWIP
jgi:NADH-quinone oxidoreductase subunit C